MTAKPPAKLAAKPFTRVVKWLVRALFAVALLVVLFLLCAWVGAAIPRNSGWQEPETGITIMVETNGIHTALVLPLVTPQKDWRGDFPASDLPQPNRDYTHVSISWGEREVFLNTPEWTDLSPATALRVATVGGDGLLHVAHYVRPAPSADHRNLRISPDAYARIVRKIEANLPPPGQRAVYRGYTDYDVFYDAPGRYTLGNTCNQWTSNTLADAGIKTGWWTPFAGGVMQWVMPTQQ
ncbi:DUF2459 domain-containing protein [Altererythrobacter confluentis]|uniref:DUF2459 domain-containing protein n=1 Tax=Allopontixanthobacter confluentis TaxID=1849021 RepID=A0A6L7GE01_9SPHN|nr:DUF2459 domain-containing protein [Allopontixanthobacter confluentis]MXP14312.1 DUF2459 domain-containing protein [Allopontixanthobacter confluentis]